MTDTKAFHEDFGRGDEPKAGGERGFGMVFQSYALFPHMTVKRNIGFGLKMRGMPKAESEQRIAEAVALVRLQGQEAKLPGQLSGGQQQRVAIARAIAVQPPLVLMDEPLSNLDAKLRSELRVELKRLHQKLAHNTMIYVTHDQIEALTLADRIAVMKGGVIQQLADPHTIYNRPRNLYVAGFIGSPPMSFLDGSVTAEGGGFVFRFGDHVIPLDGYVADTELRPEFDAILGVRPEHVEIRGENETSDTATFPAVVDLEEPMGADSLLWVTFAGQTLSVRIDSSRRFRPGDAVRLGFNLPMASVFDRKTEDRM